MLSLIEIVRFNIIDVPVFDDVIKIMLVFVTNKVPFLAIFQIFCFFDTD